MGLEEGVHIRDHLGGRVPIDGSLICCRSAQWSLLPPGSKSIPTSGSSRLTRGKIFRAAANAGAPQAKQIVDRFHLQKNFAESLEKYFSHRKRLLKKLAQQLGGRTPLPAKIPAPKASEQEAERRHAQRVIRHKKIWELFRAGSSKVDSAHIVGVSLQSVYRALEQEQPPCRPHWRSTHHVVDPYMS